MWQSRSCFLPPIDFFHLAVWSTGQSHHMDKVFPSDQFIWAVYRMVSPFSSQHRYNQYLFTSETRGTQSWLHAVANYFFHQNVPFFSSFWANLYTFFRTHVTSTFSVNTSGVMPKETWVELEWERHWIATLIWSTLKSSSVVGFWCYSCPAATPHIWHTSTYLPNFQVPASALFCHGKTGSDRK